MMYISVYPIALSVRNTNVYEEHSLGLIGQEDAEQGVELENNLSSGRHVCGALSCNHGVDGLLCSFQVWGHYLPYHARKQLAFDMWWLAGAVILVCIFKRGPLSDPANLAWYGIFPISES
jgi:Cation transport protein